jgi:AcrR family transcriptional regulator
MMCPMSTSKTYHHGNLRQALLEAARELTAEVGIEALTLREVARRAGVSHAAPYNHFADKAALTRALAVEAFGSLTNFLRLAVAAHLDPAKALKAIGQAYVGFALHNPSEFRFIFREDLRSDETGEVARAGERAYGVLLETVKHCQEVGVLPSSTDSNLLALTAWSTTHGLATLLVNGPRQELEVEATIDAVLHTLQQGLYSR